jgi:hypothetical protein
MRPPREPGVEVRPPEPPLPSHAHRGKLAGPDEPVDRPRRHLEINQNLVGRETRFKFLEDVVSHKCLFEFFLYKELYMTTTNITIQYIR